MSRMLYPGDKVVFNNTDAGQEAILTINIDRQAIDSEFACMVGKELMRLACEDGNKIDRLPVEIPFSVAITMIPW